MIESLSIIGRKKTAKTTLAMSAPTPIVLLDFELGLRRVEERFLPDKKDYTVHNYAETIVTDRKRDIKVAQEFWNTIIKDYNKALEDKDVRTVVIDTASAVWEARRMAYLAEIRETNPERKSLVPQEYFVPNRDMKMLITQAALHKKILIVVHHTREEYDAQGRPTGEEVPDGFKYTGDLVDVEFWMSKKGGKITGTIYTCGLSIAAEGIEMENPTFDKLSTLIDGYRQIT